MMPAVKHFDPIMGVDIHILIVPMVGPVPIPHPHIAMVMDPMDYVPVIGSTVNVGVMPRGTAGTTGKTIPHIPMGAPFSKPPMNESEIFMGSAMVLADGAPMTFTALPVLSCHDIGMIAPPRKKPKKTYGMVMPTSIVTAIPAGLPVLVGGPPTIDMMGVAMAGGMKALGGAFGKLRKLQKGSKKMKKVSDAVHKKAKKAMDKLGVPPNVRNKVHKGICSITGHPVDVAAGKLFTDEIDFELPGPIPIKWERTWYSTSVYDGPLGHGWHHSYDMAMRIEENVVAIRMPDGRPVAFPELNEGETAFNRMERSSLIRDSWGYAFDGNDRLRYRFFSTPTSQGHYLLHSITEKTSGSRIEFSYSADGFLREIIDSADRFIRFENDSQGRIKKIFLPTPNFESVDKQFCVVEYHYESGELIAAADALEQKIKYCYENHLLVQEVHRSGLSFYFRFDGKGQDARCVETWGDGEIYYRKLEYDKQKNITRVFDSHGFLTTYFHDGSLPTQIINPKGFASYIEYNGYAQVVREVDELGGVHCYEYDDLGNKIKQVLPDGAVTEYAYNEQRQLLEVINPCGAKWHYRYDSQGRLRSVVDPLQSETIYHYSTTALIGVTDAAGNHFKIDYDQYKNIRRISDSEQSATSWSFDRLGNVVTIIDPNKNQRTFEYDALGRANKIIEPDGNSRILKYDAEGNIVRATDKLSDIEFAYCGFNRLAERRQDGVSVKFEYDTEEYLVGIVNEKGRVYKFEYDETGALLSESGYDDVMREYFRDPLGRVTRIQRPGGRFSEYHYDDSGNVCSIKHNDGFVEHFNYRADGLLVAAKNKWVSLQFERDEIGRITREAQDDFWVESLYDSLNNRTNLKSSFGLNQNIQRNKLGDVERIDIQEDLYTVDFHRDKVGLELERTLPGGIVSRWKRDKLGRPLRHEIQYQGNTSSNSYTWGVSNRLLKIIDQLGCETHFSYDLVGNLVSSTYANGDVDLRMPDVVGNLFKTHNRSDREFGPAGQILALYEKKGTTRFEYDPEGNLTRKVTAEGHSWAYRWNGLGMLVKIIKPDGEEIDYCYDPLGRRISKKYKRKITRWVWDGNNPLHEWVEHVHLEPSERAVLSPDHEVRGARSIESQPVLPQGPPEGTYSKPITWLFEPDSHIPMAKLCGDEYYSIVCDYLGTPIAMFDQSGHRVWAGHIDIWGNFKTTEGDVSGCPFRWQGQYEDVDAGLHYNRFRFYDPGLGQYISQDPIGHAGGNLNFYAYVTDVNLMIDPFGLECWSTSRKKFWKNEATANPNKYSSNNLARMRDGKAPRMTVEVFNPKTGATEIRDYSMELHHKNIPQRVGGANVHSHSNLDALTPFEHEAVDPFRNTGRDLISVVKGVDQW